MLSVGDFWSILANFWPNFDELWQVFAEFLRVSGEGFWQILACLTSFVEVLAPSGEFLGVLASV